MIVQPSPVSNPKKSTNTRKFSLLGCCSIDTVDSDVFTDPRQPSTSPSASLSSSVNPSTSPTLSHDNISSIDNDEKNNNDIVKEKKSGGRSLPSQWTGNKSTDEEDDSSPDGSSPKKKKNVNARMNPLLPSYQLLKTIKDIPPVRFEEPSLILSEDQATSLQYYLPQQGNIWTKIYSLNQDGASLDHLLKKIENVEQILLVIQDNHGAIFGAYFNDAFKRKENYYGTRHSWLFTFENRKNIDTLRTQIAKSIKQQVQERNLNNTVTSDTYALPLTSYGEGVEQQTVRSISTVVTANSGDGGDINQLTLRSNNSVKNQSNSNNNSLRNNQSVNTNSVPPRSPSDSIDSSIWTVSSRNLQTVSGGILWPQLLNNESLMNNAMDNSDEITIKTLPDVHIYKATVKNNLYHYLKLNIHSIPIALYVGGGEGEPAIYLDEQMENCTTGACSTYLSPPLGYNKEETKKDTKVTNTNVDDKKVDEGNTVSTEPILSNDSPPSSSSSVIAPVSSSEASPAAIVSGTSEASDVPPTNTMVSSTEPKLQDLGDTTRFTPVHVEVYSFRKVLLKSMDSFSTKKPSNSQLVRQGSLSHGLSTASIQGIGTLGVVGTLLERPGEETEDV